jgi:nitric-oxide synthase, bacterial
MPPAFPAPVNAPVAAECPVAHVAGAQAKPIQSQSFRLSPVQNPWAEAESFLHQMAQEMGTGAGLAARLAEVQASIARSGTWQPSLDEVTFGARVAWRNSVRCVGRMFWPALKVFDARAARSYDDMNAALLAHIDWSTNGGDLRPALTLFAHDGPQMRILNSQLILYAGYALPNGRVMGDPKNMDLTRLAMALGWQGKGGRFDVLPLILRIGDAPPRLFEIPPEKVLQVPITHPECAGVAGLGLQWFALPAVASMALDMGGLQFTAAPSSGVYQGSEIGSFNLADPRRYNVLPAIAQALGLDTGAKNPLWRDQALVEVNRAVLHSFARAGVRIMDHHSLSASFQKFCTREAAQGRKVYGDWAWITPPLSSNLSWIWHTKTFQKVILKPGYFYQDLPQDLAQLAGAAPNEG